MEANIHDFFGSHIQVAKATEQNLPGDHSDWLAVVYVGLRSIYPDDWTSDHSWALHLLVVFVDYEWLWPLWPECLRSFSVPNATEIRVDHLVSSSQWNVTRISIGNMTPGNHFFTPGILPYITNIQVYPHPSDSPGIPRWGLVPRRMFVRVRLWPVALWARPRRSQTGGEIDWPLQNGGVDEAMWKSYKKLMFMDW